MFLQKLGKHDRVFFGMIRLKWNLKFLPKSLFMCCKGIIFHSWTLSMYNRLTQEHFKVAILCFISTLFKLPLLPKKKKKKLTLLMILKLLFCLPNCFSHTPYFITLHKFLIVLVKFKSSWDIIILLLFFLGK